MSSISATQPVTGLVETLRTEFINATRLEKATERRSILEFADELDRLTETRSDEQSRIRELNEFLAKAGQRPLSPTGNVPALLAPTTTSSARPPAGFSSASVSATGISSSIFSSLTQAPQLTDVTDSALLRLLSVNPSLETAPPLQAPVDLETAAIDSAVEIADQLASNIAEGISAAETEIATRSFAVPAAPAQSSIAAVASGAGVIVPPAVNVGQQGATSGSNQDALLAKYGIGQRGAGLRAAPPNQRNRRTTELEVDAFE